MRGRGKIRRWLGGRKWSEIKEAATKGSDAGVCALSGTCVCRPGIFLFHCRPCAANKERANGRVQVAATWGCSINWRAFPTGTR